MIISIIKIVPIPITSIMDMGRKEEMKREVPDFRIRRSRSHSLHRRWQGQQLHWKEEEVRRSLDRGEAPLESYLDGTDPFSRSRSLSLSLSLSVCVAGPCFRLSFSRYVLPVSLDGPVRRREKTLNAVLCAPSSLSHSHKTHCIVSNSLDQGKKWPLLSIRLLWLKRIRVRGRKCTCHWKGKRKQKKTSSLLMLSAALTQEDPGTRLQDYKPLEMRKKEEEIVVHMHATIRWEHWLWLKPVWWAIQCSQDDGKDRKTRTRGNEQQYSARIIIVYVFAVTTVDIYLFSTILTWKKRVYCIAGQRMQDYDGVDYLIAHWSTGDKHASGCFKDILPSQC